MPGNALGVNAVQRMIDEVIFVSALIDSGDGASGSVQGQDNFKKNTI